MNSVQDTDINFAVTTSDGKYTVIVLKRGGMSFLRYGDPWPAADNQFAHVGLILALAQEINELRLSQTVS